ncbi:hypothetical protein C8R45DRAFT_1193404 [Mycena sanguinolenta]|nr:hypothetical protein C8R45DRAFT_1193404 [Mycena sanguinolenta]
MVGSRHILYQPGACRNGKFVHRIIFFELPMSIRARHPSAGKESGISRDVCVLKEREQIGIVKYLCKIWNMKEALKPGRQTDRASKGNTNEQIETHLGVKVGQGRLCQMRSYIFGAKVQGLCNSTIGAFECIEGINRTLQRGDGFGGVQRMRDDQNQSPQWPKTQG